MNVYDEIKPTRAERTAANEEEIFNIIKDFYAKNQYTPTVREIARKSTLSSLSTISYYLNKLRDKGLIDWQPKATRTIRIIKKESSAI